MNNSQFNKDKEAKKRRDLERKAHAIINYFIKKEDLEALRLLKKHLDTVDSIINKK